MPVVHRGGTRAARSAHSKADAAARGGGLWTHRCKPEGTGPVVKRYVTKPGAYTLVQRRSSAGAGRHHGRGWNRASAARAVATIASIRTSSVFSSTAGSGTG